MLLDLFRRLFCSDLYGSQHSLLSLGIKPSIKPSQLNKRLDCSVTKHTTKFYSQVLTAWLSIYNQAVITLEDILNEYILYNQNIKIGKKMIGEKYIDNINTNLKIFDILDKN